MNRSTTDTRAELNELAKSSATLRLMLEKGLPLTKGQFMSLAMPNVPVDEWSAEELDQIPHLLRD